MQGKARQHEARQGRATCASEEGSRRVLNRSAGSKSNSADDRDWDGEEDGDGARDKDWLEGDPRTPSGSADFINVHTQS